MNDMNSIYFPQNLANSPWGDPVFYTPPLSPYQQQPSNFVGEPASPVENNINYMQGYLKSQIGRYVKVEFLIGDMLIDREGTLEEVGISYIIIQEAETDDLVLADIYSIKFVKIYY